MFILAAILPVGCARAPLNAPLARVDPSSGYRARTGAASRDGTGLMVALFFSGGGTRAAAFSYGVLRELAATPLAGGRRMLDQVSTINAVSGGSFTAAYYCLFGERIFSEYEGLFLKRDVQKELVSLCLSPANAARLWSSYYGRSDLAATYYDEILFKGATFSDLASAGPARPFLVINATDIGTGTPFPFTQEQFDRIGSDLGRFPVARAVAASAAFPIVFSPITLKNYADRTPHPGPVLSQQVQGGSDVFAGYRAALTEASRTYGDVAKHPYIYLMDGGLTDNLSLRNLLDGVTLAGGWEVVMGRLRRLGVTRLAVIVVDGTVDAEPQEAGSGEIPGSNSVVSTIGSSSINRTNRETLALVESSLALHQSRAGGQPRICLIRVDFHMSPDAAERAFFQSVPTNLSLPARTVDRLVEAGGRLLRESPAYRDLIRDLVVSGAASRNP